MSKIGFVGTGTIGGPIALRLVERNDEVMVFDTNVEATARHRELGAVLAADVAQIARDCETVFLSLPGPEQIQAVVLGDNGLLAHVGELTTIVDLSTNALAVNRNIAILAEAKGVAYLDAPVSGGKVAAEKGALAVMVGGDQNAFERVRPLIAQFGENVYHLGEAGCGTLTKLVNNQIFLSASVLIQEAFVMGAKAGMDPNALLEVIKTSSGGSYMGRVPLVLSRKFDLDVFALAIAAKDVAVALESGREINAAMPVTEAVHGIYQAALERGLGSEDFFATVKVYEEAAGIELPALKKSSKG